MPGRSWAQTCVAVLRRTTVALVIGLAACGSIQAQDSQFPCCLSRDRFFVDWQCLTFARTCGLTIEIGARLEDNWRLNSSEPNC